MRTWLVYHWLFLTAVVAAFIATASVWAADKKANQPKLEVMPATGRETVVFSKDIAPVLVDNCFGCHSGQQPRANFQMGRFVDMIRGGQSGNPWVPFQPDDSLLIKKLKGEVGKRMPQPDKRDPLPDATIAKFEKWISEGARFDGPDPKGSVQMLAALTRAKDASSTELASDRMAAAKHMWLLADPTDKPIFKETKNLLIVSNLPEAQLDEIARAAEQHATAISRQFRAPPNQPLVKGGITLFVFPDRYDYSEFGQMVEKRTLPREWRGHWKFNTIDAYAVVVPPGDTAEYSLGGILLQELSAVYIASLPGNAPEWFADAVGRVQAARLDPKAVRVREWNDRLKQLADGGKLVGLINHSLSPNDYDVAAYGFMRDLMANSAKFFQLVSDLRDGTAFDSAFTSAFGSPLQTTIAAWAKMGK